MPGSITGTWGLVQGIASILKNHLADSLGEVLDAAILRGFDGVLEVPDDYEDWRVSLSFSPTWVPRDRTNCLQIFADSTNHVSRYMNINSVRTEEVVIGALWMLSDKDPNLLEQKKAIATTAIKRCVQEWWMAELTEDCITDVVFTPTDFRFASMRMQGGSRRGLIGHLTETGDNIDNVIVGMLCRQQVDAPIKLKSP